MRNYFYIHIIKFTHEDDVCGHLLSALFTVDSNSLTVLFTKPPDGLSPYRTTSGHRSVRRFPIDIFPFCRERPVTKEPVAL